MVAELAGPDAVGDVVTPDRIVKHVVARAAQAAGAGAATSSGAGIVAARLATEHAGTRAQRRAIASASRELVADSPVNQSGPVESAVLDFLD